MAYRGENYAGPKPRDARTVTDVKRERKRPTVVAEGAADKVPVVTNPGLDRLRAVTAARNRAVAALPAPNVSTETGLMLNPALALAGILAFGDPNIKRGFRDTKALASSAKDALLNPNTSRRDKLEAAGNAAVIAGGLNFLPGRKPKAGKAPTMEKVVALPNEERLAIAPHERYVPAIVNPADPTDVRLGVPGGEHFEIPGFDPDRYWPQATVVLENGQPARVNWSRLGDRADPNAPDLPDEFFESAGKSVSDALRTRYGPGPKQIMEAMPEARRTRAKQEAGYSAERSARAARAKAAREAAGGGEAGLQAAKAEMRGELPKLPFDRLLKTFGESDSEMRAVLQPQVDEMLDFIAAHPSQQGLQYRITNTQEALKKALDGVTPQKAEIRALESVFGDEAVEFFKWRAARERALKVLNIPRSLQASYDLSANLRQLLVSGVRHPVLWQRVFWAQIKAARSQKAAVAMLDEIRARPRYDQMIDDGVKLTDIRQRPGRLEEDFIGAEYAEKIPLVGHGVRWSTRAFTVGGAKMRADLYDLFMDHAEAAGKPLTKKERQSLASVINAGTGRGGMGLDVLEKAAPLGTVLLFSPRLIASRLAFLNPYWYATLKGPARKEAASSLLSVVGLGSAVLWLAKQLGAEVEDDPRSADFGKIRVGETRVDIWGGFQQYVVNGSRYAVAETKAPSGEIKDKTREEIFWNFASGKAAPIPGLIRDLQRGRTYDYQPIDATTFGKLFVPFNIQNAYGAKDDPKLAAASLGLGGIGLGVQTYASDKPSSAPSRHRSGRYRGGPGGGGRYRGGPGRNYAGPRP